MVRVGGTCLHTIHPITHMFYISTQHVDNTQSLSNVGYGGACFLEGGVYICILVIQVIFHSWLLMILNNTYTTCNLSAVIIRIFGGSYFVDFIVT